MANTPAKKIAKKAATPKSTAPKKTAAKKAAAPKKVAAKKTETKKVAAKTAPVKKVAAKKVATKTAPVKKIAAKKVATKAAPVKKAAVKKVAKKVAPAKKVAETKTASTKTTAKKAIDIKSMSPDLLLALTVAQGMFERKAENIRILDMRKIHNASADYFVISHANNDKQVEAIAKSAEDEVKKHLDENPLHREGFENLEWILLDYFNVVAHIFQEEKRHFYGIEQLWGDAEEVVFKGK